MQVAEAAEVDKQNQEDAAVPTVVPLDHAIILHLTTSFVV